MVAGALRRWYDARMMSRRLPLAAALAAVLGLSACAGLGAGPGGPVVVTRTAPTTQDALAISSWRYLAGRGPVLVEVHGSPTDTAPAAFAEGLARVLTPPPGRAPTGFTTDPAAAASDSLRLVFLFGVPTAVNGDIACRIQDVQVNGANPSNGGTVMQAAFCSGTERITEARVTGPAVASPGDPMLREMLEAAMRNLVPLRDREEDDPGCIRMPC